MIKLNAPKGLGDAIYLRAVTLHYLDQGEQVTVFTRWPDVFCDLPVLIESLDKIPGQDGLRSVAYSSRLECPANMDEFTLRCVAAGIDGPVALRLGWKVRNRPLLAHIIKEAAGRDILVYQPLKVITSEFQELMSPQRDAFRKFLETQTDCYRVKLGHPPSIAADPDLPCECDLYGKGFIFDTFDVCTIADRFFGEICFIHTMAEALDKPVTVMFSGSAMRADNWVAGVNPQRLFHKKHLCTAIYDDV